MHQHAHRRRTDRNRREVPIDSFRETGDVVVASTAHELDDRARSLWAKSWPRDREADSWLPLWKHLDDAGQMAGYLWDDWLPAAQRAGIAADLGGDLNLGRQLLVLLAATHDIGKATPAFAVQHPRLATDVQMSGLPIDSTLGPEQRRQLPHQLASAAILAHWLTDEWSWSRASAMQLAMIVGGHHGVPPEPDVSLDDLLRPARAHLMGDELWRQAQRALLRRIVDIAGLTELLRTGTNLSVSQATQAKLTALVVMSDWLASNNGLFPLSPLGRQPDDWQPDRARSAWHLAGISSHWSIAEISAGERTFAQRFGLSTTAQPNAVQVAATAAAMSMDPCGILVIEAAMGEGKTEAALMAAEILAARAGKSGCFVAMPTQATSNAMFDRVLRWLRGIRPEAGDPESDPSVFLAHGKSRLHPSYSKMTVHGSSTGIGIDQHDESSATDSPDGDLTGHVNKWMADRRKGPLADVVIGTIDQILMAALKSRYLVLRHLGLSNKVVIIDEVHAYDAYMNVYLERALQWLGAYDVPVILLSATLPADRRKALVAAHISGRYVERMTMPVVGKRAARRAAAKAQADAAQADVPAVAASSALPPVPEAQYPRLTYTEGGVETSVYPPASGRRTSIDVRTLDDSDETLVALLRERLAEGGCALVVRNTVRRAQQSMAVLTEAFGSETTMLNHARFLSHDRAARDRDLLARFGGPAASRAGARPHLAIVIATQVAEQSFDIDFDLLVTDLAPVDIVLQRMGRLHRHQRGPQECERPSMLREAACWLTGVADWGAEPPTPDPGSSAVYGDRALLRAAFLLGLASGQPLRVSLPDDIDPLVQQAYADDMPPPTSWSKAVADAEAAYVHQRNDKESRAQVYRLAAPKAPPASLAGWLHAFVGDPDSPLGQAEVRDGDDSVEVLLLVADDSGELHVPPWIDHPLAGALVPQLQAPDDDLAEAIAGCSVRLPRRMSQGRAGDAVIKDLECQWYFPEWQRHPLLKGQLVLVADAEGNARTAGWTVHYDPVIGLEARRDQR